MPLRGSDLIARRKFAMASPFYCKFSLLQSARVQGVKFQGSNVQESRKLKDYMIERPEPKGIDVLCGLKHFAIITYAVPSERFQGIFPERFKLDTVEINGQEMGLISVVHSSMLTSPQQSSRSRNSQWVKLTTEYILSIVKLVSVVYGSLALR